jgi:hypothetical protein
VWLQLIDAELIGKDVISPLNALVDVVVQLLDLAGEV